MSVETAGETTSVATSGSFRAAALIAALVGAAGSVVLLLREGERTPRLLLGMYVGWVLSPFAALVWAGVVSTRWRTGTRVALYGVTLIVAVVSLVVYGLVAWGQLRARPAAVFLMVPLASWVLQAISVPLAAYQSGKTGAST